MSADRRVAAELDLIQRIAHAALDEDFKRLDEHLPKSRRGSRVQMILNSFEDRLKTIEQCAKDALSHLGEPRP